MNFTTQEIQFLAAWTREVLANYWTGPAHLLRQQRAARENDLIALVAAWSIVSGKPDVTISDLALDTAPVWPWDTKGELHERAEEASRLTDVAATGGELGKIKGFRRQFGMVD